MGADMGRVDTDQIHTDQVHMRKMRTVQAHIILAKEAVGFPSVFSLSVY